MQPTEPDYAPGQIVHHTNGRTSLGEVVIIAAHPDRLVVADLNGDHHLVHRNEVSGR